MNIHFRPSDGEIMQVDNSPIADPYNEWDVITVKADSDFDNALWKVDTTRRRLVKKTKTERAAARTPKDWEVKSLVFSELSATDALMPIDRPVSNREEWIAYRQALRDLSKGQPTAEKMLDRFPLRPDGQDAAASLRARIP